MALPTRIEEAVLYGILNNEEYARFVTPYIKPEYFNDPPERLIYTVFQKSFSKYNKLPTPSMLSLDVNASSGQSDSIVADAQSILKGLVGGKDESYDKDWLVDETEKWCKDRALMLAIMESLEIIEGTSKTNKSKDGLPKLFEEALQVSFDSTIGHDYMDDSAKRYDFYHQEDTRIPFDLDYFNQITKGGLPKKTLNILMAATGVGKTLVKCHLAANWLMRGYNVLYITMEMSEERISERIDANLMGVSLNDMENLDREVFVSKMDAIRAKTTGKLIVKEYPTAQAHTGHFRALIEELKTKRNFIPDVIIIDYMNICASQRLRMGSNVGSYHYIKAVAEEIRGLAVEYNVPVVTSTQTNRSGVNNSDIELTETSDSLGGPMTADMMLALIVTPELEEDGQILVKQLKNRYTDPGKLRRFIIGVDKSRMRLYNVTQDFHDLAADASHHPDPKRPRKAQEDEDRPLFDRTPTGQRIAAEASSAFKYD